ncbi:MAG: hypothetical protein AUJ33_00720 [Parcubacteria group bacterium CG1_02_40_25]|nr:MAG: hypothetical protein AUJ33_00720 [Parcubacteria group bacterium CG1_02_40_25]
MLEKDKKLELQSELIKLVDAVCRVGDALNKQGEVVLATELKQQATEIYKLFFIGTKRDLLLQIEYLTGLFDLAQTRHLIKDVNFIVLNREFGVFRQKLGNDLTGAVKAGAEAQNFHPANHKQRLQKQSIKIKKPLKQKKQFNARQEKLLSVIKNKKEISISEVSDMFKGQVTDKTIRRDLIYLMKCGLIGRRGDKRWTKYYLK